MTKTTESQKRATADFVAKVAYLTAREGTGQRREDARRHCERLGVDYHAPTFAEALKP